MTGANLGHKVVFAFCGHPGAGKSTLCRRFGELQGLPWLDTDTCMTADEIAAIQTGRYTQAMRLANIERYATRVRELLASSPAVAIADGLPNDEARAFLRSELPEAEVVFVLVETPRALWEARLARRSGSPVSIDVAAADAYVRENWHEPDAAFGHEVIANGEDIATVDEALRFLWRRHRRPR